MVRVRPLLFAVGIFLILAVCAVRPAAAQTVPQTTCGGTSGINSCLTAGFLQTLAVDCSAAAPAGLISTALAQITDRDGPNLVQVSGTCNVGFNVTGFNRLTIQGNPSATITKGTNIVESRGVLLKSLTFDFATGAGQNLAMNGSQVVLDGVTVKNSTNGTAISVGASGLGFTGAPSLITANSCNGLSLGAGQVTVVNVTISNNGQGQNCGSQRNGINVMGGGAVVLANQLAVNGVLTDAAVDISGNSGDGIAVEGGTVRSNAEGGAALIHIHDNVGLGMELFGASSADLEGHIQLDGNALGGGDGFPPGQIVTAAGASLFIGEGAVVHGGLTAGFNASMIIGDGGPMSITGGVSLIQGAMAFLTAANTIDTLSCDPSSWVFNSDNASIIGANTTCLGSAPTGTVGPPGPQGPPGPVTFGGSFTATGAPGFVAKFADATNVGSSAIFDNNSGSIGLGTTVPADKLHVQFTNTNGGMTGLAVQNLGNTATSYSGMLFYDQNGALGQFQGFNNVTHEYRINNIASGASINFMIGSSSKFLVANSGNVGIGATTPATKLQVVGDVRLGTTGTNGCVQNFNGGAIAGTCSSDERLKQNIQPFELVLDKLARLHPVSYEWRSGAHPEYNFGPGRTTGLIAQEVETLFPEMVAEDARGYKAVNYSELPLLLLQAVRELKTENERLRSDLDGQRRQFLSELEVIKRGSR